MKKIIKEVYPYVVIIIVVVLIRSFLITPAIVDGDSMVPTLLNNEVVLLNKIDLRLNEIERFDIVVINYNKDKLVKRIIGLPNEKIEYIDNTLYINDEIVNSKIDFEYTKNFTCELGDNEYFVMGDNRNVSKDSRRFGPINKKNILGTVNIILFPFSKMGSI